MEIEYIHTSLVGESVTITQKDYREVIVNSKNNLKSIRIINSNGYPLFEQSYSNDIKQIKIDESTYQPGIYFAHIQLMNGKVETKKFLKL